MEQSNHSLQDKVAKLAKENAKLKEIVNKEKTIKMKESDTKTKPLRKDKSSYIEAIVNQSQVSINENTIN